MMRLGLAAVTAIVVISIAGAAYAYKAQIFSLTDIGAESVPSLQENAISTATSTPEDRASSDAQPPIRLAKAPVVGAANSQKSTQANGAENAPAQSTQTKSTETTTSEQDKRVDTGEGATFKYKTASNVVQGVTLTDKEDDLPIQVVVLVRCVYASQYFKTSSQPLDELNFTVGSGVIVSPEGHVLTAAHVVRKKTLGTDDTGRTWTLDRCQISPTLEYRTLIKSNDRYGIGDSSFTDVEIVYEPSDAVYLDTKGVDAALLKIKGGGPYKYVRPIPSLVYVESNIYDFIALGYPGRDVQLAQPFQRYDGVLQGIFSVQGGACETGKYTTPCGWRYLLARWLPDFKWYFGKYTYWGVETDTARPGFSGAPVLYKGNLVGILTHSKLKEEIGPDTEFDLAIVLTSYDIMQHFEEAGVHF